MPSAHVLRVFLCYLEPSIVFKAKVARHVRIFVIFTIKVNRGFKVFIIGGTS